MKKIRFETRILTIITADTILNTSRDENFPELHLFFDKEEDNWRFSYVKTSEVSSQINTINNLFEILECEATSEMAGRKLRELLYKTPDGDGKWGDGWEIAGFGACQSDRFIDLFGKSIMTMVELEKITAKRENAEISKY